jgi:hypothetical protein
MRRPHIGELNWKIFWVTLVWAAILFPGFLIGPIRVYLGKWPVLLDPSYLLVVLGGILFGVWGGVLSPLVAMTAAFALHHDVSLSLLLVAVPLQMLNGTILPAVRFRLLSGVRHLRLKALMKYLFWSLMVMPLLNGAYYAVFGRQYFWGVIAPSPWGSLGIHGLYYALLAIFPGEPLFRMATREARDLGLWLEDRWSRWSPRLVYFRQRGRVMLALGLCLLPVLLMAVLAQRSMARRQVLLQQLWVMQRSSWHVSTGQTLARYLQSLQVTLDVSALEVRRLLDQPEAIPAFLLLVLKRDPDVLQMEFVPTGASDASERQSLFLSGAPANWSGSGATIWFDRRGSSAWSVTLGKAIPANVQTEAGRLWLKGRADQLVETLDVHRRRFAARAEIVLRERNGRILLGDPLGVDLKPGLPARFENMPGRWRCFVAWFPLIHDRWDLYYLEPLEVPPGMRDALAEHALWSGAIHLFMFMILFGVALLARIIPVHAPPGPPGPGANA